MKGAGRGAVRTQVVIHTHACTCPAGLGNPGTLEHMLQATPTHPHRSRRQAVHICSEYLITHAPRRSWEPWHAGTLIFMYITLAQVFYAAQVVNAGSHVQV